MIVVYHAKRPYLAQLACSLHLGLAREAEPFLPRDWRLAPLLVAGRDSTGAAVCCLAHGRHSGLYRRALAGFATIFGLSLAWVDVDRTVARAGAATRLRAWLASRLPGFFGRRWRAGLAEVLRPDLLDR